MAALAVAWLGQTPTANLDGAAPGIGCGARALGHGGLAELVDQLPSDVSLNAAESEESLFSVEQEDLPPADSIEALLAQLAWPEGGAGAAVTCERITLPPEAEPAIPQDPAAAEAFIANDPRRQDVRMAVGVMRTGESWCALRLKAYDSDNSVLGSANLVPELVEALQGTFR